MANLALEVVTRGPDRFLVARYQRSLDAAVRMATREIARRARRKAPVLTGALKTSIFATTSGGSDFVARRLWAQRKYLRGPVGPHGKRQPRKRGVPFHTLTEGALAVTTQRPLLGITGSTILYARIAEFGIGRRIPKPFLKKATAEVAPGFRARVEQILRQGRGQR